MSSAGDHPEPDAAREADPLSEDVPEAYEAGPGPEHASACESAGLVEATRRGCVELRGARAAGLLDRITSGPVGDAGAERGVPACFLSAKGRLIEAFALFRLGGGGSEGEASVFRLLLFEPCRGDLLRALRKYALLEDVEVVDRSSGIAPLVLLGPRVDDALREVCGAVPGAEALARREAHVDGVPVDLVRVTGRLSEGPRGGVEVWTPRSSLPQVRQRLLEAAGAQGGGPVGRRAFEILRVERGIPRRGVDLGEESFPNEVGWEHALTYDKCYVGQEVVARMRTYGSVSRRLMHALPEGGGVPAPGAAIRQGEALAGRVTSAVHSIAEGRPLAIARIKRRFFDASEGLSVEMEGGAVPVALRPLPGTDGASAASGEDAAKR